MKFDLVNTSASLVFGVNVTDLNFGVHINLVTTNQEQLCGSVKHVSLWDFDLGYLFILITASVSSKTYNIALESEFFVLDVINVCWNHVGVLDWDGVMHVWLDNCRWVSPWLSLGSSCFVPFGLKYFNHQIPESVSGNTVQA